MPLRSRTTLFLAAALLAMPLAVSADEISEDVLNGFFARLTILEDHPQCQGPGETAFEVAFETGRLSFDAYTTNEWDALRISRSGKLLPEPLTCHIVTSRGLERTIVQVDCPEEELAESTFDRFALAEMVVTISGSFTACQSPLSFDVIESAWSVTVQGRDGMTEVAGAFVTFPEEGCAEGTLREGPAAYMSYVQPSAFGIPDASTSRVPIWQFGVEPAPPTHIRIFLDELPIVADSEGVPVVFGTAQVTLFPTSDGQSACYDGLCSLPQRMQDLPFGFLPFQCEQ